MDSTLTLNINGKAVQRNADLVMPLLWVLRDLLNMTGTKVGCGVAACVWTAGSICGCRRRCPRCGNYCYSGGPRSS
ncbi:MAG: hypothetical protein H7228_17115 [Polaromonas sp.]|nr:hypothetical protein [Polaromonas sp.]